MPVRMRDCGAYVTGVKTSEEVANVFTKMRTATTTSGRPRRKNASFLHRRRGVKSAEEFVDVFTKMRTATTTSGRPWRKHTTFLHRRSASIAARAAGQPWACATRLLWAAVRSGAVPRRDAGVVGGAVRPW